MSASRHLALSIPPPTTLRGAAQPSPTTTATSWLRSSALPQVTVVGSWASLRPSGCGHSAVGSMLCAVRVPSHGLSRRRAGCVGSLRGGAALAAACRLPVHRMGRSRARAARRDGDRARRRLPRRVGPAAALVPGPARVAGLCVRPDVSSLQPCGGRVAWSACNPMVRLQPCACWVAWSACNPAG